ncbi:MAG: SDR family oxidoreductase [Acidimicrobiaceae bacterium]|nr:SDR family oxidoreductase [Acidimicrobiaceae bacterium]
MDLRNHAAIVTGAGSGIGAAVARRLLESGAGVALVGRRVDPLRTVAAGFGDRALVRSLDVSDASAVTEAVPEITETLGTPTILVNSAGIAMPEHLVDITPAVWDEVIAINLSGSYYMSREVALRMGSGGSIVNLGSELSLFGMALYVHYCASKAGVVGMTKAMALELAPRGIRVNAVCPGPVDTPMKDAELEFFDDPAAAYEEGKERVPLARYATAEEVAEMVLYVAASALYSTGACFSIDGGTAAA